MLASHRWNGVRLTLLLAACGDLSKGTSHDTVADVQQRTYAHCGYTVSADAVKRIIFTRRCIALPLIACMAISDPGVKHSCSSLIPSKFNVHYLPLANMSVCDAPVRF